MNEIEEMEEGQTPQGGGGGEPRGKKRKKRVLADWARCLGRLPGGRRCEAARLHHSLYCVFHDPEMVERRLRLNQAIPYEHPDQVQRLLGEVVEAVRKKRLAPRAGNTLGYLATLLLQNQERVGKEKSRVRGAQESAEMQAAVNEFLVERGERRRLEREAREGQEAEPERD